MKDRLDFIEITPNSGKQAKQLVVMLHGYGANCHDLVSLSTDFANILPDAHFIFVNAPEQCELGDFHECYQWFSLQSMDLNVVVPQIREAHGLLDNFIDEQLQRLNLQSKDLLLCGFSQGAMMSMYNAIRRVDEIGGVLAYSGKFIVDDSIDNEFANRPKICWVHGDSDQVVPFESMMEAEEICEHLAIPLETHKIVGQPHCISVEGLEIGIRFLETVFRTKS